MEEGGDARIIYIESMKTSQISTLSHFITIETHFGTLEHYICAETRNKCSEDLVVILEEIATTLYPEESFEIFLLPSEKGSYRDIIKFVKKHKVGSAAGAVIAVGTLVLGYLNYSDTHEAHIHNMDVAIIDDTRKCIELRKMLEDLDEEYHIENISEEKLVKICGNISLKKRKNDFYNTIKKDQLIKSNETIMKNDSGKLLFSKQIDRDDFPQYIEPIPDQKYSGENIEGVIELISPVMKQKKEGKGIAWRGTYYGDDIIWNNILILGKGEDIDFYMQDVDFKTQINNKERTFAIGDNMEVTLNIKGELKGDIFQNRGIYVKEVNSYNEVLIEHSLRKIKEASNVPDGQTNIFDHFL